MKTYTMKQDEIAKDWLVVDAKDVPLGRLATQVATFLRGKHKPTFTPSLDMGDNVIVLNASQVKLTGLKADKKFYVHHTGYPSGQRFTPVSQLVAAGRPEEIVLRAVKGMLPKTKLGRAQLTNLRVYADANHPHSAQQPKTVTI